MQVAKHTPELAQLVVGAGGVGALVDYVGATKGNTRLPGIMALGYIAAFSETLGLSVIAEKGLVSPHNPLSVFMVHKICVSAHDLACLHGYCWRRVVRQVTAALSENAKGKSRRSAALAAELGWHGSCSMQIQCGAVLAAQAHT